MEFDEFLKIQGCKTGRHVFAKKVKAGAVRVPMTNKGSQYSDLLQHPEDNLVKCRMDHYQTPKEVHVTVYAKQADKAKSIVKFTEDQVIILRLLTSYRTQYLNPVSYNLSSSCLQANDLRRPSSYMGQSTPLHHPLRSSVRR